MASNRLGPSSDDGGTPHSTWAQRWTGLIEDLTVIAAALAGLTRQLVLVALLVGMALTVLRGQSLHEFQEGVKALRSTLL